MKSTPDHHPTVWIINKVTGQTRSNRWDQNDHEGPLPAEPISKQSGSQSSDEVSYEEEALADRLEVDIVVTHEGPALHNRVLQRIYLHKFLNFNFRGFLNVRAILGLEIN